MYIMQEYVKRGSKIAQLIDSPDLDVNDISETKLCSLYSTYIPNNQSSNSEEATWGLIMYSFDETTLTLS